MKTKNPTRTYRVTLLNGEEIEIRTSRPTAFVLVGPETYFSTHATLEGALKNLALWQKRNPAVVTGHRPVPATLVEEAAA